MKWYLALQAAKQILTTEGAVQFSHQLWGDFIQYPNQVNFYATFNNISEGDVAYYDPKTIMNMDKIPSTLINQGSAIPSFPLFGVVFAVIPLMLLKMKAKAKKQPDFSILLSN